MNREQARTAYLTCRTCRMMWSQGVEYRRAYVANIVFLEQYRNKLIASREVTRTMEIEYVS